MSGRIYLLDEQSNLMAMDEAAYDSESLLQQMLAEHPDLLAGEQIDTASPRRWLLVTREMSVPGEEAGAGRWSLDHLFLDQDAIPTLIEVKRSSDTRIRREVIGQMLDYAANAVAYWPVEEVRAKFESRCDQAGDDADQVLADFLRGSQEPGDFWHQVKTNLQAGRIRLIFLGDSIPPELRRVVEFLNEQMDPAEVLAIEVKQYQGKGVKTLVPRVLGQTETARQKKSASSPKASQWDEAKFLQSITERVGPDGANTARRLLHWAQQRNLQIWWGRGREDGSFFPQYLGKQGKHFLFSAWTYGAIEIQFQHMNAEPFAQHELRAELARRLSQIDGVEIPNEALTRRPSFKINLLANEPALQQFLETFDWALGEIEGR